MIHRTVHYSGRVQGIGFRASTASIARIHDVAGTVENLPDGRVRLIAQGEAEEIRAFFDDIDRALGRHIQNAEVADEPLDPSLENPQALNAFRVKR